MAAVADAVTNVCGWITAYALPQNPAPAAKMIAALNHISGGRGGLNIVVEACKVEFVLDYKFSNFLVEKVIGPVFNHIASSFVDAFVLRAKQVYGPR